jgi:MFS family permease
VPVGAAMGYAIGGEVGGYWGWRYAFLISGAPGLFVAAMCLAIDEPAVGSADEPAPA